MQVGRVWGRVDDRFCKFPADTKNYFQEIQPAGSKRFLILQFQRDQSLATHAHEFCLCEELNHEVSNPLHSPFNLGSEISCFLMLMTVIYTARTVRQSHTTEVFSMLIYKHLISYLTQCKVRVASRKNINTQRSVCYYFLR